MSYHDYSVSGLGALPPAAALTNITTEQTKNLAKQVDAATRVQLLQAGIAALPGCYGARTANCINGRYDASPAWGRERCEAIAYAYIGDYDQMQAKVDALPFCDERTPLIYAAVGALAGLVIGGIIGVSLR